MMEISWGPFDILAPAIHAINTSLMSLLPDLLIIALWSLITSSLSLYLYKKVSPQKNLVLLDAEIKKLQSNLYGFDVPDEHMLPLMGRYLALSLKRVGIVLLPTAISVIPVLFVVAGLAATYDAAEIIHLGYSWMRHWLVSFLAFSLIFSLFFKWHWDIR